MQNANFKRNPRTSPDEVNAKYFPLSFFAIVTKLLPRNFATELQYLLASKTFSHVASFMAKRVMNNYFLKNKIQSTFWTRLIAQRP